MTDLMTGFAPLAAMTFVGICVLWLAWRAIRFLFRPHRPASDLATHAAPEKSRSDPPLTAPARIPSSVPDAADILSLKASIDSLTRQIASLEKRLTPVDSKGQVPQAPVQRPEPRRPLERAQVNPEAPVIVPDRRI